MFCCQDALVAELVDAHASGACGRSPVEVQVLFRAPSKLKKKTSQTERSFCIMRTYLNTCPNFYIDFCCERGFIKHNHHYIFYINSAKGGNHENTYLCQRYYL